MDKVKALALELGLVETFVVDQGSISKSLSTCGTLLPGVKQTFDYVIVIDFESTCWNSKGQQPKWQNLAEVIEFPAVLLNLKTGLIEDQFHQYVMPVENPILSEFCVELTGITQEVVNSGIPLGTCMMLFNQWIHKLCSEKIMSFHKPSVGHKTCTFVTWSDWDLSVCLLNETKRKQIRRPDIFSQWIDLRQSYRKFYQRKPQGLKGALAELGLPFKGREHSGIVDAKNTANLIYHMVKDGCQLSITSSSELSPPLVSRKRCPLGSLKNTLTPVSREPQSLKLKVFKGSVNSSGYQRSEVWRSGNPSAQICTDEEHKIGLRKKSNPCSTKKKEFSSVQGNYTSPKRQNVSLSSCKRTPPLCRCGRRAVCKVANSPGPNQRRSFFSCPNHRRSLGMISKSCSFFMWC